jgi:hypothetical protein
MEFANLQKQIKKDGDQEVTLLSDDLDASVTIPTRPLSGASLWNVATASVRGLSHEKAGLPCQDSSKWNELTQDQVIVIAVADGAGSACLSQVGSDVATQSVIDFFTTLLDFNWHSASDEALHTLLRDSVASGRDQVNEEALRRNVTVTDLATTLIVVVAAPTFVALAQVGDGGAVVQSTSEDIKLLVRPVQGEYINQTDFITSNDALSRIQLTVLREEVAGVSAFTDGLQMLALVYPQAEPFVPFFGPLFSFVNELASPADEPQASKRLAEFLLSPAVRQRADDDLTLALATLRPHRDVQENTGAEIKPAPGITEQENECTL